MMTQKNFLSNKSINNLNSLESSEINESLKYINKEIDMVRSDVSENTKIKIVRFKGDYFIKTFSIMNEDYRDKNASMNFIF